MTETGAKVITMAGEVFDLEIGQLSRAEKAAITRRANRAKRLKKPREIAKRELEAMRLIAISQELLAEARADLARWSRLSRRSYAAQSVVCLESWRRTHT